MKNQTIYKANCYPPTNDGRLLVIDMCINEFEEKCARLFNGVDNFELIEVASDKYLSWYWRSTKLENGADINLAKIEVLNALHRGQVVPVPMTVILRSDRASDRYKVADGRHRSLWLAINGAPLIPLRVPCDLAMALKHEIMGFDPENS